VEEETAAMTRKKMEYAFQVFLYQTNNKVL
jgi:hypothetical protein